MDICILGSGSKGNSIYISSGATSILIDAGFSGKEIVHRLNAMGLRPEGLSAILVSHEHTDHLQGVGVLSRRFHIPVYINPKTYCACRGCLRGADQIVHFESGVEFVIENLEIHPFSVSHDAADPSGFTIRDPSRKIGLATDLGKATRMVKTHLQHCHMLILEANHDPRMLETGPYPWPLKQRVKSRMGHLSNEESRDLLQDVCHEDLAHVVLAHISENNNTPELALRTVGAAVPAHARLSIAFQNRATGIFTI